jgi:HEAT repeat protein
MYKRNYIAILAIFLLTMLVGCGTTRTPFLYNVTSYEGVEKYCQDPADIPALKEALMADEILSYKYEDWLECIDRIGGPTALPALAEVMARAEESGVRAMSVSLIAQRQGPTIIPILQQVMEDSKPYVRSRAVSALIERNAVQALIPTLRDESNAVREMTISFLSRRLGHPGVIPALCEARAAISELAEKADQHPCVIPTMIAVLYQFSDSKGGQPDFLFDALRVLRSNFDHPAVLPALRELAKDGGSDMRGYAVATFGKRLDHPASLPVLKAAVLERSRHVQMLAIGDLSDSKIDPSEIIPVYIEYLQKYPKGKMTLFVAEYLGSQHKAAKSALPALKELTLGFSPLKQSFYVPEMAQSCVPFLSWPMDCQISFLLSRISYIDADSAHQMAERIIRESGRPLARSSAAAWLGKHDAPYEILIELVQYDADPRVRGQAVRSLEFIVSSVTHTQKDRPSEIIRKATKPLVELGRRESHDEVRRNVISALRHFRSTEAQRFLEGELKTSENKSHRRIAAVSLYTYKNAAARRSLRQALSDPDWGVRSNAAQSLGWMKDAGAIPLMAKILNEDPDDSAKENSAKALIKIGTPAALAALEKGLSHQNTRMRLRLIWVLEEEMGTRALPIFERRLAIETTPNVKRGLQKVIQALKASEERAKT